MLIDWKKWKVWGAATSVTLVLLLAALILDPEHWLFLFCSMATLLAAFVGILYGLLLLLRVSTATDGFILWSVIFFLAAGIVNPHTGGGPQFTFAFVNGIGLFFNLSMTILSSTAPRIYSFLTRPFIKIFSDKAHARITASTIFLGNMFFLIFPFFAQAWHLYMNQEYPNFASFLHKVFG